MAQKFKKPPPVKLATSDEFMEALAQGNASKTEAILRRLNGLGPSELQFLADHFSGSGSQGFKKLIPYRLEFVKRQRGVHADYLKKAVEDASIRRIYERARAKFGKYDTAIDEVKKATKLGRTRISRAIAEK